MLDALLDLFGGKKFSSYMSTSEPWPIAIPAVEIQFYFGEMFGAIAVSKIFSLIYTPLPRKRNAQSDFTWTVISAETTSYHFQCRPVKNWKL